MEKILIVVDMQNDFIGGSLGSADAQAIVPHVVKKIYEFIVYVFILADLSWIVVHLFTCLKIFNTCCS